MTKFIYTNECDKMEFGDFIYIHTKDLMNDNKEFEIEFKPFFKSKSYNQIKGIHKLCQIYANYMSDTIGSKVSFENAKISLKYAIDYTRLANQDEAFVEVLRMKREKEVLGIKITIKEFNSLVENLQLNLKVPKSFKEASLEEMQDIIQKVHELGIDRKWHNLQLSNHEIQEMISYYS
jgi:hypothetical protein